MWKKVSDFFDIRIVWVRGHDKTFGNEEADKHAGEGAEVKDDAGERHTRPSDWGFHEFRRDFPHHFAQEQKHAFRLFQCENEGEAKGENSALDAKKRNIAGRPNTGTKRKKDEGQGEEEDVDRETSVMPNILEIQTAIAEVASTCGRPPKRFSTKLKTTTTRSCS